MKNANRTRTYECWSAMKQRCLNPRAVEYANYGGRGIRICERWVVFVNFLADMGERPEGLQIDRIDNNGGYEPSNCRWTTSKENQRNRSNTKFLVVNGERKSLAQWADEVGLAQRTIWSRIDTGWSDERAVTTPHHWKSKQGAL